MSRIFRGLKAAVDPFLLTIIAVLVLAIAFPLPPGALAVAQRAADLAIMALFLLYGMRLRTRDVIAGLRNWRLQLAILAATYVLFPLVGIAARPLAEPLLGAALAAGLLYTALLPSTVQSSVAFTSVARGNIAGALCAATVSNILGVFLTPLLVLLVMGRAGAEGGGIGEVVLLILVPFVVGQLVQRWTGEWLRTHRPVTLLVDRGTIVIAVYAAVASATAANVWDGVAVWQILGLVLASGVLLAIMLAATWWGGKAIGLDRGDRIALLMCGSKKSLATGLPMGLVLFPGATAATMVVPVVVFHQLQIMVCTVIAAHLGEQAEGEAIAAR